jgi:large repetitive protein
MKSLRKSRSSDRRRSTQRQNFLRLERLEDRMVLSGASPVAVNDLYHALMNQSLEVDAPAGVLANDTDAEGDALSAALFSGPTNGTLSLNQDGSFNYTPNDGFSGTDSFIYFANDGTSNSLLAAVTLQVSGSENTAPVSQDDSYSVAEDNVLNIGFTEGVLGNDTDTDGDPLSAVLVDGPANGTLALNGDGSFTYIPNADFFGVDTFTYVANDGTADGNLATVTITVDPVNDSPVAVNDSYTMDEDTSLDGNVLDNDTDPDGDTLTATLVGGPLNGSLVLNADGTFTYTSNENFNGLDGFSYLVSDGHGNSQVATVTISINPVNDAPVAASDEYTTAEDTPLVIAAPGILENDSDVDGDPLTAVVVSGPANGSLELNADGSFTYTPSENFNGTDSFSYLANDGQADSEVATVTITVTPVNDDPVAVDDAYEVNEDETLTVDVAGGVLANDTDVDGDPLTVSLVSGPANGSLTLNADGSFEYTPTSNFNGSDTFTYSVSDGTATAEATVTIAVNPVNDLPETVNDEYTTEEDTPLVIEAPGVLANDSDVDGDPLEAILVNPPQHGSVTLNADGSFTYTPSENFNGVDGFSYLANDGTGNSEVASVTISVTPVNDAPVASDDVYATDEDTELTVDAAGGVLANDIDVDGDPLTVELVSGPANGSLTLNADGSFSYMPAADFNGTDSFVYRVSDGSLTSEATATINVNSVNDPPVGVNDEYTVDEDDTLTVDAAGGVLANDTDVDGDALIAALVSGPANGTLTLNADGSFTYTPNADFNGSDSFVYSVSDGEFTSEATATITVNPVNDAPVAVDDTYAVDEDTELTVDAAGGGQRHRCLANDQRPGEPINADGSFSWPNFNRQLHLVTASKRPKRRTITVSVNDAPVAVDGHGGRRTADVCGPVCWQRDIDGDPLTPRQWLTLNADGSFSYTPSADFNGSDSFTYSVTDGIETAEATVTITVNPVNDAPVAVDDAYTVDEDTELTVDAAGGVLANDTDVDGDPLTVSLVSGPANGSLTLNADGSFSYLPSADFNGSDSFVYSVTDGIETAEATVTITVNPVNDAPVAVDDAYTVDEDTELTVDAAGGVLANDTDVDGDPLTVSLVSGPANGSLTLNADGSFSYTPSADFNGSDSFTYSVTDGIETAEATVSITVNPINDAPVAVADEYAVDEGQTLEVAAAGVLANDTDVDGDPLSAILVSGPANGSLTLNADGSFSYTPSAGFSGTDSFIYKANDGSLESEATVTITVNEVQDEESIVFDDAYSTGEDVVLTVGADGGVLANDFDAQGEPLEATLVSGPANGTLVLNADGSFTYTPAADWHGTDSFTYSVETSLGATLEGTATIVVQPLNDMPVAVNDAYEVVEGEVSGNVLGNDTDVDGDSLTATLLWGPQNGTLTFNADGTFTYVADEGFEGEDYFWYQANDGIANSNVAKVTLLVELTGADNEFPESADDAYTVEAGETLTVDAAGGVLANDTDADGDPLTVELVTGPTNGTLVLNTDGSFEYTPNEGFVGEDSFTYQALDAEGAGNVATVVITVTPAAGENELPVSVDDAYTLEVDETLIVDVAGGVLANDTDADGDPLTAELVTGPANGTLVFNADGSFTYVPNGGFEGEDTFTYKALDGTGEGNVATVTLTVTPEGTTLPIEAGSDAYSVDAGETLTVDAPGILANDIDAEGDPLTAVLVMGPANGTLVLNADGSFSYVPNEGFSGADSFTYQASDGSNLSNIATVSIDVNPVGSENNRPIAGNNSYTVESGSVLEVAPEFGVLINDSDPDGDPITASLFGAPLHGSVTLNPDGSFTYTPNEGYVGLDSFIYWVNDGQVNSALAAVTIHVTESSDPGETPLPEDDDDCLDEELVDSLVSGDSDPSAIDDLLSDGGWMS